MKELTIARRYAKAFFQLACEQKKTKAWKEELERFSVANHQEAKLLLVLADFRVPLAMRFQMLDEVGKVLSFSPETFSFFKLLLQKKRIELFPLVLTFYVTLFEDSEKLASAELIVPYAKMADQICDRVQALLAEKLGRQAQCNVKIDPSLLGGFVVQVGDQVFDASYKGRLEKMKDALLAQ